MSRSVEVQRLGVDGDEEASIRATEEIDVLGSRFRRRWPTRSEPHSVLAGRSFEHVDELRAAVGVVWVGHVGLETVHLGGLTVGSPEGLVLDTVDGFGDFPRNGVAVREYEFRHCFAPCWLRRPYRRWMRVWHAKSEQRVAANGRCSADRVSKGGFHLVTWEADSGGRTGDFSGAQLDRVPFDGACCLGVAAWWRRLALACLRSVSVSTRRQLLLASDATVSTTISFSERPLPMSQLEMR